MSSKRRRDHAPGAGPPRGSPGDIAVPDTVGPVAEDGWPRIGPLDGPGLVAAVNAATGAGLAYAGRLSGGNAGAVAAGRPDGTRVVLTRWDGWQLDRWPALAPLLERVRAAGYPIPALQVVPLPAGGAATVQERVDGAPAHRPTAGLVTDLLRLVELQAGVAARPASRLADLHLSADGPGFCLHGPLREHSAATREVLAWVEEVGRSAPADALHGADLVHLDLHMGNVLVHRDDPDRVAGVVDWAGAAVGDRAFDLVTLGFDLSWHGEPETPVLDRLAAADPGRLRAYAAHMSLRLVDWLLRHGGEQDVRRWVAVAHRWRALTG